MRALLACRLAARLAPRAAAELHSCCCAAATTAAHAAARAPAWRGEPAAGPACSRGFASRAGGKASDSEAAEAEAAEGEELPSVTVLLEQLGEKESALEETVKQVADLQDRVLRTHADMENLRQRTARQSETERRFAVQGLAKDLLDVADNMERCLGALPDDTRAAAEAGEQPEGAGAAGVALHQLAVGLSMTARVLEKALAKHGVQRFKPDEGAALDPHAMHALFQLPCPAGKERGTVAVVTKTGYRLHDRVIRPAEVGVFE